MCMHAICYICLIFEMVSKTFLRHPALSPSSNTPDSTHPLISRDFKGIVHPKMKILSSFTPPQLVPNLYECLCSAEHKGRYSEECGKQSSSGAPLTSIVFFFPTMEVNGAPKQPGYKRSSKYLPLCSAEQRRQNFHFWVNYPFKT